MIIHFICRGNAFRSRMAEAYLNSLQIPDLSAISSGTVAEMHSYSNANLFKLTKEILDKHNVGDFNKESWDQLTVDRSQLGDLLIFLNQNVKIEYLKTFILTQKSLIWDIADLDEVSPHPTSDIEIKNFIESTYQRIVVRVDNLVRSLLVV